VQDVDNLYVVDASFFPSGSSVDPALTIMANALRGGDHPKARLGAGGPRTAAMSTVNSMVPLELL
jgi:choline dehydrogenase-like flavoprotein